MQPSSTDISVNILRAAAFACARIVRAGGPSFADAFVDQEVPGAADLLGPAIGVLLLRVLARTLSGFFAKHVGVVLEKLGGVLRDVRVFVREAAAGLLGICLSIMTGRGGDTEPSPYLALVWEQAKLGARSDVAGIAHGALLAQGALLGGARMASLQQVSDIHAATRARLHTTALRQIRTSDPLLRHTAMKLVAALAAYDTAAFLEPDSSTETTGLADAMDVLIERLDNPADRNVAFESIGLLAAAVASNVRPPHLPALYTCLRMLVRSPIAPLLMSPLHDLLDDLFACGLSPELGVLLEDMNTLDRLLDVLSRALTGAPFVPCGAPPISPPPTPVNGYYSPAKGGRISPKTPPSLSASQPGTPRSSRKISGSGKTALNLDFTPLTIGRREGAQAGKTASGHDTSRWVDGWTIIVGASNDAAMLRLALDTLASFDFEGQNLLDFVRDAAQPYLAHPVPEVRAAAARCCASLLSGSRLLYYSSQNAVDIVDTVVGRLVRIGVADPHTRVRALALSVLAASFDKLLAQAEHARGLLVAVNDETFAVRTDPSLQLISDLKYAPAARTRSDSAQLIALTVQTATHALDPYTIPLLEVLLPAASDSAPGVAASALGALGELCAANGSSVLASGHMETLFKVIIAALADPAARSRRDAALQSLGKVVSGTGVVVQPLIDYPDLLPAMGRMLAQETRVHSREEILKVLGILGAVDPYRPTQLEDDVLKATVVRKAYIDISVPLGGAAGEEYYLKVVMHVLLELLRNPVRDAAHHMAVEAIMSIFKTQGLSAVNFLPQIFPTFIAVVRDASVRFQEFHLQQVAILLDIIGEHTRPYLDSLLDLLYTYWASSPALRVSLASLLSALARAMDTELRAHVLGWFPSSLKMHILNSLGYLAGCLEPYLTLILPSVLTVAENDRGDFQARKAAIVAVQRLAERIPMGVMLGRIVHPFVKILREENDPEILSLVMDSLAVLAMRAGSDFSLFAPLVESVSSQTHYQHLSERIVNESELVRSLVFRKPDPRLVEGLTDLGQSRGANISAPPSSSDLRAAMDASNVRNEQDWVDWLNRMCSRMLYMAPSPALRACIQLLGLETTVVTEVARKLLPVSFLACWMTASAGDQDGLTTSLEMALKHESSPQEVVMTILELVESMERQGKTLAIDHKDLAEAAFNCHAYAAALHYMEHEFHTSDPHRARNVEKLIDVNTKLRLLDSAYEQWFEKLGRWQDALAGYDRQVDAAARLGINTPPTVLLGRLRCLHGLGDWEAVESAAVDTWTVSDMQLRRAVAPLAAEAAWGQGQYDQVDQMVQAMETDGRDRPFYAAVVAIHRGQFAEAQSSISRCRQLVDPDFATLLVEDYERGYEHMVRAQMLSELEEVIQYKQVPDKSVEQQHIRDKWMKRLRGGEANIEVWHQMLHVRSLAIDPQEDPAMWIKFSNLCRKNQRLDLTKRVLELHTHEGGAPPEVIYSYMKWMWAAGGLDRNQAPMELDRLAGEMRHDISRARQLMAQGGDADAGSPDLSSIRAAEKMLARCCLKHAQWMQRGDQNWVQANPDEVLRSISSATSLDPTWWKAWHMWALANIETLGSVEALADYHLDDIDGGILASRAVLAVQGLVKAITLAKKSTLQDVLRLLTQLFKFGGHQTVSDAVYKGFRKLPVDTWLEVIPQIIARLSAPNQLIRSNIHFALKEIGRSHPQALIYPLTVAQKSPSKPRQEAARIIMNSVAQHDFELVEQAKCVSQEFIRVAILWHELWREGLDTASKLFVERGDVDGMLAILDPLHDMVEAGPTTADEITFVTSNGRDLESARQECRNYLTSLNAADLDRAWILYTTVYRRLEKIPPTPLLNLEQVSPYLLRARNLILAVPGTYQPGRPVLTIQKVSPQLTVLIKSNKKPRRAAITASDGQDYEFAVKGHEDLRQDERVTQFFGLANTLFANDADSVKRHLHVQRLSVIPIAPNAGLLGWAQETDTLHHLIEQYRTSRDVLLNLENRLMLQMAPEYDCLTVMQKVEVFEHAMNSTMGMDLYRILWLKSMSAADWLSRRTVYTRSVAVTSMIGYVIGLGDRHPSNILIHRGTGKIIHIDFGDCFEVAMKREKYPETVPFRLTRMMVLAMEVATVSGTFRNTSEITLGLMRANRDSLLAVLEALIYDPLISWRSAGELISQGEHRNDRALLVYQRVKNKLTGRDFNENEVLSIQQQYIRLVHQARSEENLCQLYFGWVACW
ncbi:FAT domain-containing protein [Auriculariales sp. MPI-PUGE-AT-0066]|nr:FAT domain-containing protein [Auriculariales sp. MPI-PUGE-AT-0066]